MLLNKTLSPTLIKWIKYAFWLALLVTLVVCLLPTTPKVQVQNFDKIVHTSMYIVLGFIARFAYPNAHYFKHLLPVLIAFGIGIEVLQGLSGYRTFSWLDMIANTAGALAAGACLLLMNRHISQSDRDN
jgi:VanZ family protein